MLKNAKPSEYFLGAILRAYDRESKITDRVTCSVTCSGLWEHVVMECLRHNAFLTMFEWDESRAKNINRIGTIAETIRRGFVPGLRLVTDEKGHEVVKECLRESLRESLK